jgi:hypothetical protein
LMADAVDKLSELDRSFPELMKAEMAFSQLTADK